MAYAIWTDWLVLLLCMHTAQPILPDLLLMRSQCHSMAAKYIMRKELKVFIQGIVISYLSCSCLYFNTIYYLNNYWIKYQPPAWYVMVCVRMRMYLLAKLCICRRSQNPILIFIYKFLLHRNSSGVRLIDATKSITFIHRLIIILGKHIIHASRDGTLNDCARYVRSSTYVLLSC